MSAFITLSVQLDACSWHIPAVVVLLNSDEKHRFLRSVVARKAAVRIREIPAKMILVLRAGKSPLLTIPERILWIDPMTVTG